MYIYSIFNWTLCCDWNGSLVREPKLCFKGKGIDITRIDVYFTSVYVKFFDLMILRKCPFVNFLKLLKQIWIKKIEMYFIIETTGFYTILFKSSNILNMTTYRYTHCEVDSETGTKQITGKGGKLLVGNVAFFWSRGCLITTWK